MYYIYPQDMSRKLFMSAKRHKEHRYLSGTKMSGKNAEGEGLLHGQEGARRRLQRAYRTERKYSVNYLIQTSQNQHFNFIHDISLLSA